MSYHILRSWEHPTDPTLRCIELYCDVTNKVFYREAEKIGKKDFVEA